MKRPGPFICAKDIQRVTGRGEAYARRTLRVIKNRIGKERHQLVTWDEFCEFIGISREKLEEYL
jgi:hypothetical protein